ncbi:MAG: hypothetical protein DI562_02420 [Stenotrophomonas acidaminiphila]|nr:MAG: hypothetical protein DI562_02420 [Stenotrophomonas acidaminiphila]
MAVALLSASTACGTAFAGPFEVGDTDTEDGWSLEVESMRVRSGNHVSRTHPAIGLTWGFGERFELAFGSGYGISAFDNERRRHGAHDLELAFKWALREASDTSAGIAVEPALSLPTGDRGAGMSEEEAVLELPIRLSRMVGRGRWTGQAAWSTAMRSEEAAWSVGVLYERPVTRTVALGAEVIHEQVVDDAAGAVQRGNVGVSWAPHRQWEVSGRFGRSWRHPAGERQASIRIGIEYRFD